MKLHILLLVPLALVLVSCANNSEESRIHHINDTLAKASAALDQGDLKRSCVALRAAMHAQGVQVEEVGAAFELQLAYALGDKGGCLAVLGKLESTAKGRVKRLRQYLKDTHNLGDTPKEGLSTLKRLSAGTSVLMLVALSRGHSVHTTPVRERQYSELFSLMSRHADIFIRGPHR